MILTHRAVDALILADEEWIIDLLHARVHVDGRVGGAADPLGHLQRIRPWIRRRARIRPEVRVGSALLDGGVKET